MSEPMVEEIQLIRFDWAIKTLLRDKANFDVLEGFLSALLAEDIIIEQVLDSESNADEGRKFNRVDMLVHDSQGRKLIIEVQNERETDYLERLLFGTSKVIVDNLPLGSDYRQIAKVISISILYFNLGIGDDYVYKGLTAFTGLHTGKALKVRERIPDGASFRYRVKNIFPEYYLINVERFEDVIQTPIDEWIYFLKHSAVRTDFQARHIDKAAQKLAVLRMSPQERRSYERYIDAIVVERNVLETAKQEGRQEGLKEGRQEGLQEGEKSLLIRLLERKFGPLSKKYRTKLNKADAETLLVFGDRVLTATTVDEVFINSPLPSKP